MSSRWKADPMSEHASNSRLDNDVFAALASQLEYQQQIGGVALSPDQQMLLGTFLANRRDLLKQEGEQGSVNDGETAAPRASQRAAASPARPEARAESQPNAEQRHPSTSEGAPPASAQQQADRATAQEPKTRKRPNLAPPKEEGSERRSKQRGGGLPSVESFISAKTGRLPWQDPVAETPEVSDSAQPSAAASASGNSKATDVPGADVGSNGPDESRATAAPDVEPVSTASAAPHRESLEDIREALGDCTRCGLSETRTNIVFGVGSPTARLMFIGEAPGYFEDQNAEPFVGKAGQLLDKMIVAMGLSRSEVYISNILKCRPPDNRNPHGDEVAHCSPFLKRQILSVDPDVIITLGKFASTFVLGREIRITEDRGRWQEAYGRAVMPTFHPSYLLRKPESKREAWQDLQAVMAKLGLDEAGS